jgi:hypothetical protein
LRRSTWPSSSTTCGSRWILPPLAIRAFRGTLHYPVVTSRRKIEACCIVVEHGRQRKPRRGDRRGLPSVMVARRLRGGLRFHGATDVDNIVGDDTEPDRAAHTDVALVSAAVEAVPPLDDANASLGPGAPLLTVAASVSSARVCVRGSCPIRGLEARGGRYTEANDTLGANVWSNDPLPA